MMFLQRLTLGSVVVVAVASSLELLLDDAGTHVRPGADWINAEGECAKQGHGGGFHHNNGVHNGWTPADEDRFHKVQHGDAFAVWNFSISKDGCYWVEEFHPATVGCEFSLSSRVPVHIHFCKGLHTAGLVDQSQKAGQWNRLVRLPFYTSHTAAIHLSAKGFHDFEAAGVWAADAFRLTWDAESCHHEEAEADEAVAPPAEAETTEQVKQLLKQEEATLPLLQALVDDSDASILGSTLEPVSQCPVTASQTFHHDGLQKGRRAEATFHFDPPHDGCYLVEEMHPQLNQCTAPSNTKVHVNYCKGLEAAGTVNQSANPGQWTFLAALPFYAGYPGKVTLSNEGTESGTLAVFDQIRFTWSSKSCRSRDAHPRQAEIRMTVDFQNVASRLSEFGSALMTKLARLANVPAKSLRLTGLRPGSIIAEILVLPSVVDEPLATGLDAAQTIERLRSAVVSNAAELCALTGGPVEGCNVELKDLGVARASIRRVYQPQTQQEDEKEEAQTDLGSHTAMIAVCASFGVLFICILGGVIVTRFRKAKRGLPTSINEASSTAESKVTASMEEGKVEGKVEEEKAEDMSDTHSTDCPGSDKQSEPSVSGDIDAAADEKKSNPDLAVVSALAGQSI